MDYVSLFVEFISFDTMSFRSTHLAVNDRVPYSSWLNKILSIYHMSITYEGMFALPFIYGGYLCYFLVLAIVNKSINIHRCWSIFLRFISFRQYPCASLTLLCENIQDKLLGRVFSVAYILTVDPLYSHLWHCPWISGEAEHHCRVSILVWSCLLHNSQEAIRWRKKLRGRT